MQLTVFAKNRTANDGRPFKTYFSKLTKKDGTQVTVQIKFREECGTPNQCPCNIVVNKNDANFTEKEKTYTDAKTQEEKQTVVRILWVSKWTDGEPCVDHSMDEFVD